MTAAMRRILSIMPSGHETRIATGSTGLWELSIDIDGEWYVAFADEYIFIVIELRDAYEAKPHVIESPWGDPVCTN